jgi:hypothetical protein
MRVSVVSTRQTSPSMTPLGVPMIATPFPPAPSQTNQQRENTKNEEQ